MAQKGIGIYAAADAGWASHLKDIFHNSGIGKTAYAIVELDLVGRVKNFVQSIPSGDSSPPIGEVHFQEKRLRYQNHAEKLDGSARLPNLIQNGDTIHIVWIGHASYYSSGKKEAATYRSAKFLPNMNKAEDHLMSAKELARCIKAVCEAGGGTQYPASLCIYSCHSFDARQKIANSGTILSVSSNPLAVQVATKLKAMYDPLPATTCTVYGLTEAMMGIKIRSSTCAPTGNGYQSQVV